MTPKQLDAYPKAVLIRAARSLGWKGNEASYAKSEFVAWLTAHADFHAAEVLKALNAASEGNTPELFPTKPTAHAMPPADAASQMMQLIQAMAAGSLNEERVQEMIQAAVSSIKVPAPVVIAIAGFEPVTLPEGEHRHPMFEKCLRLAQSGINVLMVGPAGTGKTTLAKQIADALGLSFGALHCSAGISESQLLGWLLPTGESGRFEYQAAQFADLYQRGDSLFLLDEIDAADPNLLMVLNGALANGHLHVPQNINEPTVARGKRAYVMAAANTYGHGADMQYAGRNQLDAATLDRFYIVHIGYDANLERLLTGRESLSFRPWKPAPADSDYRADVIHLADWLDAVRIKASDSKLRRVISTRAYTKASQARQAGIPCEEIKADLLAGWTRDELAKVAA